MGEYIDDETAVYTILSVLVLLYALIIPGDLLAGVTIVALLAIHRRVGHIDRPDVV